MSVVLLLQRRQRRRKKYRFLLSSSSFSSSLRFSNSLRFRSSLRFGINFSISINSCGVECSVGMRAGKITFAVRQRCCTVRSNITLIVLCLRFDAIKQRRFLHRDASIGQLMLCGKAGNDEGRSERVVAVRLRCIIFNCLRICGWNSCSLNNWLAALRTLIVVFNDSYGCFLAALAFALRQLYSKR